MEVYEFNRCYRNLPVLVTGATRYIGAELVKQLVAAGAQTTVLARPTSSTALLDALGNKISILRYDGSGESMREIVRRSEPQVTFHLASSGDLPDSLNTVDTILDANLRLGTQLVQAISEMGCGRFVTTATYWQHVNGSAFNPVNLYAATKAAFEPIVEYYSLAHSLSSLCLEIFDVYGPEDPRNKLLPFLCNAARRGDKLELTEGIQFINLVHIRDITRGYLLAGARLLASESPTFEKFALSAESSLTLREFLGLFQRQLGRELSIEWGVKPYRERAVLKPWIQRPPLPGWKPKYSLEEGVSEVLRAEGLV